MDSLIEVIVRSQNVWISGLVSLIVAVFASKVTLALNKRDRLHERELFLREKYEQLGEVASQVLINLQKFMHSHREVVLASKHEADTIAINRLKILTLNYFPEMEDVTRELINSIFETEQLIFKYTEGAKTQSMIDFLGNNNTYGRATNKYYTANNKWIVEYKKHSKRYCFPTIK